MRSGDDVKRITRRRLLMGTGVVGGFSIASALLAACSASATSTPEPTKSAAPVAPAQATATTAPQAAAPAAPTAAPTQPAAAAAAPANPQAAKIVLLFDGNYDAPDRKDRNQVYTDFQTKNPGITFDIRSLPGAKEWDRLARTSIAAGEQADLLTINGQFVRAWVRDNLLYELSTDNETAPVFQRIEAAFLDAASPGGKRYYTVPLFVASGAEVCVYYYNKALLDKAGVQPPKTIDDLKAMVAPLKAVGAAPEVHPSGEIWWNPLLVMWIQPMVVANKPIEFTEKTQKGEVKYNSPEWLKTFEIISNFTKDGVFLAGSGALGMDQAVQLFFTGKAAATQNGSWTLPSLRKPPAGATFDVHITGLPLVSPAPKAQPLLAFAGFSISAGSKNKDACVSWIKYASDPEIDASLVAKYQQFSSQSASNAKIADPISKEIAPWFKDGIPPLDWLWEPEITTEIQNQVQGLVKGDTKPQAVGDAVQAKAEQLRREGRSYYK